MSSVKVLQASAWYPPYDIGGTEVYLQGLVTGLITRGIQTSVIVPRHAGAPETYIDAETLVETYPVNAKPGSDEIKCGLPHVGFDQFRKRLAAHRGAIYHQHSWTRGCGLHHLRAAREFGLPTVLTVHVPGNICLRGTMLLHGSEPCDGLVTDRRCGACWAESRGLPRVVAHAVSRMPASLAAAMRTGRSRLSTALSARSLGLERAAGLREMINQSDRVVAVCQWLFNSLAINGAPIDKLVLCRQGVSTGLNNEKFSHSTAKKMGPLRLLYLGRFSNIKGVDVIVKAMRALPPDSEVRLTIHAIAAQGEERYAAEVCALADGNSRIVFERPVDREQLPGLMAEHDVLVVPSQWLETGPLVVLEAQALGLFVLGSRLGGIAELVSEEDGGLLVASGDIAGWRMAIERLSFLKANGKLPRPGRTVRTMDRVVDEMADLYGSLS